jgi:hypothetical protein
LEAASHDTMIADFTGWEHAKFESQFERVLKALRADGVARETGG